MLIIKIMKELFSHKILLISTITVPIPHTLFKVCKKFNNRTILNSIFSTMDILICHCRVHLDNNHNSSLILGIVQDRILLIDTSCNNNKPRSLIIAFHHSPILICATINSSTKLSEKIAVELSKKCCLQ